MPKNDVYIRSLSGIVFLAVVIVPVVLGFIPLLVLVAVISSLCIAEFLKMQKANNKINTFYVFKINLILLLLASNLFPQVGRLLILLIIVITLIYLTIKLFRHSTEIINEVISPFFSIIYISLPFFCFILFCQQNGFATYSYDWHRALFVLIMVWSSDTFAYVFGRLFGKHLLFPKLSPKKTIEGLIGGTILAAIAGGFLASLWNIFGITPGIVLGALVSVFGTVGDLFASAIKRNAGVKDSGDLIPGHGGVLDRFDAFLFASVIVYAWYQIGPFIYMFFYAPTFK